MSQYSFVRKQKYVVVEEAVVVFSRSQRDYNRALQIRSCSLRLHPSGDPGESLHDLRMYTGDGLWKDFATYKAFICAFSPSSSKRDQAKAVERWMLSSPINYSNACAAFVKKPSSAADLVYNSTFPLAPQASSSSALYQKILRIPQGVWRKRSRRSCGINYQWMRRTKVNRIT